jgi:hypothetical protein
VLRRVNLRPKARPRPGRAALLLPPLLAILVALALLAVATRLFAHDLPARVTVLAYLKPEGRTLHVVLRAPLEAMRDVRLPLRGGEGEGDYLDAARAGPALREAARLWIADYLALYEDDVPAGAPVVVAARASLPSDRSFERWERALAHVRAPQDTGAALAGLPWRQAVLDVALDYPIRSAAARFSVRPALAHLGVHTTTVLRFLPPGGAERAFRLEGDPGLVRLDPRWHQAAARFVALGFRHILGGADHLLFVLCLVIPVRRVRPLVVVVTAFTAAHSITLAASALGLAPDALWFPPLVEALVALSILYLALANAVGPRPGARGAAGEAPADRRWVLAFGFGLVHGFAFSFALRDSMQFAGAHLATALLAFNVGVELGQLLVVALAVPALALLFRRAVPARAGTIALSSLVAHTAWHWLLDRGAVLRRFDLAWPAMDRALLASATRGAALLAVVAAALWGLSALADRTARGARGHEMGAD